MILHAGNARKMLPRQRKPARDRWTAFLLSLVVPGTGQLYVGHWSCLAWFVGAAGLSALTTWLASLAPIPGLGLNILGLALLGLASAEHARRCLDPAGDGVTSKVQCDLAGASTVRLRIEVEVPRPVAEVWSVVSDFERFACVDPFHTRVVLDGPAPRAGVGLALQHRAFGITLWRSGRLLTWHEGRGYAFSDVSSRGVHTGFPHVFFVTVQPRPRRSDDSRSESTTITCVRIEVRGKWTARCLPHWLRHGWLRYVCLEHARLLRAWFSQESTWLTTPSPWMVDEPRTTHSGVR
jgi:hypothetical protein